MPDLIRPRPRRPGQAAIIVVLAVVVGAVMLLWAWNTLAVDLFQAPAARFKHAFAFALLAAAVVALPLVLGRRSNA